MVLVGDTKNQTSSSKNTASRASGAFGGRRLYLPPFLSYQKTETSFGFLYSSWFIFQKKMCKNVKNDDFSPKKPKPQNVSLTNQTLQA